MARTTTSGPRIRHRGRVKLKGLKRIPLTGLTTSTTEQAEPSCRRISQRTIRNSLQPTSKRKTARSKRLRWKKSYPIALQMFAVSSWLQESFEN